jgi:hypothetical protein
MEQGATPSVGILDERSCPCGHQIGWLEFKIRYPWPEAKQQRAVMSLDTLRQQLIQEGPGDSEWVAERLAPENLKFLFDESQRSTEYPQIYLGVSHDWSQRFTPLMVNRDEIEKAYEKLEEAKAASRSVSSSASHSEGHSSGT